MELHFGRSFALGRESQTPPGWNCALGRSFGLGRITNPTEVELHLGENYKPQPNAIARFFASAEITNPARMEPDLEDLLPLGKLQTPPAWNLQNHPLADRIALGKILSPFENYKPNL
jgi:hypothetical protein